MKIVMENTLISIIGQPLAEQQLNQALQTQSPANMYIFCGPRGVGKLDAARRFAAELTRGSVADVIHPSNQLYGEDKKMGSLAVDSVRAMRRDVYIKPYAAKHKVFVIQNADALNVQAQNAMLKIFEEPPDYAVFVLVADSVGGMLPTIISRAQIVRFFKLTQQAIIEILRAEYAEPAALQRMCELCGGDAGIARLFCRDKSALQSVINFMHVVKRIQNGDASAVYDAQACLASCNNAAPDDDLHALYLPLFFNALETLYPASADRRALAACDLISNTRDALKVNVHFEIAISELTLGLYEIFRDRGK